MMLPHIARCFLLYAILIQSYFLVAQGTVWSLESVQYESTITSRDLKAIRDVNTWHPGMHGEWDHPRSGSFYWLKFPANSLPDSGMLLLPGQSSIKVFAMRDGGMTEFPIGLSTPMHKLPLRGSPDVLPLDKIPSDSRELIFRISPFSQLPYPITVRYLTPGEHKELQQRKFLHQKWYYLFVGAGVFALLFLAAFAMVQFAENRKKAYLFYGLYMLCMALYFGKVLEYRYETPVFWGFFYDGYGLAEVVALMASYIMYILFARHFLGFKEHGVGLERFTAVWIVLCAVLALTGCILSLLHTSSSGFYQTYTVVRFMMPLFVLFFLWKVVRARLPFGKYVVLGTVFLLAGGLVALGITFLGRNATSWAGQPLFAMLCGVLLESFCFALGLGRQTRQMELDKIATQQQLIQRLEQEARLERDLRASQAQTLRAQMNPHFIFNALNSVQHFILGEDKDAAVRYLSRISQLIRRILQNSTTAHVVLDEEIGMLKDYVEVEQMRFHPAFAFKCIIDPELDTEMQRIPHMMIQPFLENAILHGLVPKKDRGKLTMEFHAAGDTAVEVTITDNGIGRSEAAQVVAQSTRKHQSISTSSIASRIRLLLPEVSEPVVYTDLKHTDGTAAGTTVRIIVPLIQ